MLTQLEGIIIGALAFLIIGLFHPLVIKGEYHFSAKIWPIFLAAGLASLSAAYFVNQTLLSSCLGILGFTSIWSIHEILEQEKRVEKGWFPQNPKRKG
jgi:hypothetical protein